MVLRQRTTFQGYSWGPVSLPPAMRDGLFPSPHSHSALELVVVVGDVVVVEVVVAVVAVDVDVVVVGGGQREGTSGQKQQ